MNPCGRLAARLSLGLVVGLLAAPLLLLLPTAGSDREALLAASTAHLAATTGLALALSLWAVWPTFRRWPRESSWFAGVPDRGRFLATVAVHVAAVGGVTLLVSLAWAAALRLQPSLQLLQLMSALNVIWGLAGLTAAVAFLTRRLAKRTARTATVAAGLAFLAYCEWALWRYLANVGFAGDGGWKVDAGAMWRYILPFDMVAALLVLGVVALALRQVGSAVAPQRTVETGPALSS